ncbi:hypothetical protein [Pontibacter akesuensis]|nr:hypothetical protein [Pontibacter akesuensis]GHA55909.1 hypothetical protein GCM10007389_04310 [Pontibacter akesuensis]
MEDKGRAEGAIFKQICTVNELDPQKIREEAQERFPEKFRQQNNEELLIWTAFDHKARTLVQSITATENQDHSLDHAAELYSIDGDPAAPAFVINDKAIQDIYDKDKAAKLIEVLGQVKLPIRA